MFDRPTAWQLQHKVLSCWQQLAGSSWPEGSRVQEPTLLLVDGPKSPASGNLHSSPLSQPVGDMSLMISNSCVTERQMACDAREV